MSSSGIQELQTTSDLYREIQADSSKLNQWQMNNRMALADKDKEIAQYDVIIANQEEKLRNSKSELAKLRSKYESTRAATEEAEEREEYLEKIFKTQESKVKFLREMVSVHGQSLTITAKVDKKVKNKLKSVTECFEQLKIQKEETNDQIRRKIQLKDKEIGAFERMTYAEKAQLKATIEKLEQKNEELARKKQHLDEKRVGRKEEFQNINNDLSKTLNDKAKTLAELEEEIGEKEEFFQQCQSKMEDLKENIAKMVAEGKFLINSRNELSDCCNKLEADLDDLLKQKEERDEKLAQLSQDAIATSVTVRDLMTKLDKTLDENEKLTSVVNGLNADLASVKDEDEREVNRLNAGYTERCDEVEKVENELKLVLEKEAGIDAELNASSKNVDTMLNIAEQKQLTIEQLQMKRADLGKNLETAESKSISAMKAKDAAEKEVEALNRHREQNDVLQVEVDHLKATIKSLESENSELKSKRSNLDSEMMQKIEALKETLVATEESVRAAEKEFEDYPNYEEEEAQLEAQLFAEDENQLMVREKQNVIMKEKREKYDTDTKKLIAMIQTEKQKTSDLKRTLANLKMELEEINAKLQTDQTAVGSSQSYEATTPASRQGSSQSFAAKTPGSMQGSSQSFAAKTPGSKQGSSQSFAAKTPASRQGSSQSFAAKTPGSRQGSSQSFTAKPLAAKSPRRPGNNQSAAPPKVNTFDANDDSSDSDDPFSVKPMQVETKQVQRSAGNKKQHKPNWVKGGSKRGQRFSPDSD